MDVLDEADSDFFHQHIPDDLRDAGLGTGVADHRASRISDDPDHARHEVFSGIAGQRLSPSRLARIYEFGVVDCNDHLFGMGHYRHALGIAGIEELRLNIENLWSDFSRRSWPSRRQIRP